MAIENIKKYTVDFNIVFWLYLINPKKKLASILFIFGKKSSFNDNKM
jgi:hypothetical protein